MAAPHDAPSAGAGARPRRYELLVFDWDGTLQDSASAIAACIQGACTDLGHPEPPLERARHVIGLGLHDALQHVLPGIPQSAYAAIVERYRARFALSASEVRLFDGTPRLLAQLSERGHVLAIATGKGSAGLRRALETTGIGGFFADWRCADMCAPKPAPDMLLELMEAFAVPASSTLMVGDTTHDLDMAAAAGVDALAVTHGAHTREALASRAPLACLDSTAELAQWLHVNA